MRYLSSRTEKGMERVMVGFTEASQEANTVAREMISMVQSSVAGNLANREGDGGTLMPDQLTEHISQTEKLISDYEVKIEKKRAARMTIKSSADSSNQMKMKLKSLKNDIADVKKMISTLSNTLEHQCTQLHPPSQVHLTEATFDCNS